MLSGTIAGSPGHVELLLQPLCSIALQLLQGCVGLLHKGESCLDVRLRIKGHQIHSLRNCFGDGTIPDGKLAMGDLSGCSLKSLLPGQLVNLALNEVGIPYLENHHIVITHLGNN